MLLFRNNQEYFQKIHTLIGLLFNYFQFIYKIGIGFCSTSCSVICSNGTWASNQLSTKSIVFSGRWKILSTDANNQKS